jgi:lipoprotein-releasing system ATP-binding protein
MPLVRVADLNKYYVAGTARLHVLRDLGLEVSAGEMVAVVGASGVGKSTLLHILGGLDRADGGAVEVGGQLLGAMSDAALVAFRNRQVGFVFQFHHLLPEFTAVENVEMPMRIAGTAPGEARARAMELLSRVGLSERVEHRPSMLSGGEQQRVAVARAMSRRPPVILADEPTGNLDSATGSQIVELLLAANRAHGSTVVLVTHDAALAAHADRTIALRDGRVVGDQAGNGGRP